MTVSYATRFPNSWLNADGLFVKFGTDEQVVGKTGEYEDTFANEQVMQLEVDFNDMPVAGTDYVIDTNAPIRKGSRIQSVTVVVETAVVGAGSTFNVGLIEDDFATFGGTTSGTDDGLVDDLAAASLTPVGTQVALTVGSTSAGTMLGLTTALDLFVTCKVNTAVWTAGKVNIYVKYWLPSTTE